MKTCDLIEICYENEDLQVWDAILDKLMDEEINAINDIYDFEGVNND